MNVAEVWLDGFGRVRDGVREVLDGASEPVLTARVDPQANTVAWLIWHLSRIQDDHLATAFGGEQVWLAEGFADRWALPFDPADTGYGHGPEEVSAVPGRAEELAAYSEAVDRATRRQLSWVTADDLDRVVDERWDPPVTLGVRLVSVLADGLQHLGQAAYVRGVVERRSA